MNRLFAFTLIAAAVSFSIIAVQAMPLGSGYHDSLVVPVAGGCGLGFHRGPLGGCRVNGWYEGRYWGTPGPVIVAPRVVGSCGGRGAHEVCGPYGRCRMVCN